MAETVTTSRIRIELTPEQIQQIREATGRAVSALEWMPEAPGERRGPTGQQAMRQPQRVPPQRPLSDVEGRISHVFLALPGADTGLVSGALGCFRGVFLALGPAVRYTVLHHPAQAGDLTRLAADCGVSDLDLLPWREGWRWKLRDGNGRVVGESLCIGRLPWPDFTPWVQDSFLVAGRGGQHRTIWASPVVCRRAGGLDEDVPPLLAEHLGWPCRMLPCALEIGNLLVDGRHAILGADVLAANGAEPVDRLLALLRGGEEIPCQPLILLPGTPQPVFHQDLYLTLAGKDPETGRPRALVGSVRQACAVAAAPAGDADLDPALDALADRLHAQGYEVARLPLLPILSESSETRWISHNNCLVEVFRQPDGRTCRRVTLPAYATGRGAEFAELDAAAAQAWRELGFEIVFARGPFYWLSGMAGSLRCIVKVLSREASTPHEEARRVNASKERR